jgi:hypothetical protein
MPGLYGYLLLEAEKFCPRSTSTPNYYANSLKHCRLLADYFLIKSRSVTWYLNIHQYFRKFRVFNGAKCGEQRFLNHDGKRKALSLTGFGLEMPFVRSQSSCENPECALRDQCLLIASQMMSSIALSTFCHLMGCVRVEAMRPGSAMHRSITAKKGEIATGCSACNTPETLTKSHDAA